MTPLPPHFSFHSCHNYLCKGGMTSLVTSVPRVQTMLELSVHSQHTWTAWWGSRFSTTKIPPAQLVIREKAVMP